MFTPTGEDGALIGEVLAEQSLDVTLCRDVVDLCMTVPEGAGVVVIAEEAVTHEALEVLTTIIESDPVWSLLPIVLLASADSPRNDRGSQPSLFGDRALVTILVRPCSVASLVSSVQTALYARSRQYEVRSLLDQLEARSNELKRSNDDLGRFASAAAHDLQEPLRMVTSYTTLIERRIADRLDDRSREYMRSVLAGTQRMSQLIKSLLNYGRAGSAKLDLTAFRADVAIGEAVHNLQVSIAESQAVMQLGELPTITADRTLFIQLMQNLMSNAIKYTRGQPVVRVEARADHDHWLFSITDNGIGIAADQVERIFEAFRRGPDATDRDGFGIGLATCRRIVDVHGGRIWVESTPGVGSTFHFTLRAVRHGEQLENVALK